MRRRRRLCQSLRSRCPTTRRLPSRRKVTQWISTARAGGIAGSLFRDSESGRARLACWAFSRISVAYITSRVGLVGREGMVGVTLALGIPESPARAIVQGKGTAMRMPAPEFAKEVKRNEGLLAAVHRQAYASMALAMHVAACNKEHALEAAPRALAPYEPRLPGNQHLRDHPGVPRPDARGTTAIGQYRGVGPAAPWVSEL